MTYAKCKIIGNEKNIFDFLMNELTINDSSKINIANHTGIKNQPDITSFKIVGNNNNEYTSYMIKCCNIIITTPINDRYVIEEKSKYGLELECYTSEKIKHLKIAQVAKKYNLKIKIK